jgi:hypothetical protein
MVTLDLSLGRRRLGVFSRPEFKALALKEAPVEKRTHWEVIHHDRAFAIPKSLGGKALVHILRDPARQGNLLAVRKDKLNSPYGQFHLYSVSPSGDEFPVASAALEFPPGHQAPLLVSLGVLPYSLRKFSSRPRGTQKLQIPPFDLDSSVVKLPKGAKSYVYRRRGLATLMVRIAEDLAALTGHGRIEAHFGPKLQPIAEERFGWTPFRLPYFLGPSYYKKLR